jgi:VWFA-related protein
MKLRSKYSVFFLFVAASVLLILVGCGGGGGGGDNPVSPSPSPTGADLSITKTSSVTTPDVGKDVVFSITVSNAGPANATGVVVTDVLPSGFTFVDTSGAYNPVTGVWSIGTVATGTSQSLTITATVNPTGNYTNLAQVTASNDSTPNNNTAGVAVPPPAINVSLNQIQTDCTTPGETDVQAFVTVVDQIGDPITTLLKSDFTVSENQNPPLTAAQYDVQFVGTIPLSVAVVLDYSTSIFDSGVNDVMEDAAIAFINQLPTNSQAAIIKFGLSVQVIQNFTSNKTLLIQAIESPFNPEEGTEIYPAILEALTETANQPPENRKAVVIFTDGRQKPDPSPSGITIDDVIDSAVDKDIPIFPIGLGIDINVDDLSRLADESGGIFYQSIKPEDVDEIYQQLADALIINQYVVSYRSLLTGGTPVTLTVGATYNGLMDSDTKAFTSCP